MCVLLTERRGHLHDFAASTPGSVINSPLVAAQSRADLKSHVQQQRELQGSA
jgi:hypothetical protein